MPKGANRDNASRLNLMSQLFVPNKLKIATGFKFQTILRQASQAHIETKN